MEFLQSEAHGIAYHKKEGWKYQICRCKTVPIGMCQGAVQVAPTPGCIDNDHKGYGHPPKDVQGQIAVIQDFGLLVYGHSG
jgi:hypothetical protein